MRELFVKTDYGLNEPITSNHLPICINCGCQITRDNDSGWEQFTKDGKTTQSICKECDQLSTKNIKKSN